MPGVAKSRGCEACGAPLPTPSKAASGGTAPGGRPARYCSGACRQRAFRRRAERREPPRTELPGRGLPPPALDAFVGRERELSRLRTLLRSSRLLTLTGPGGVGKTRMALELAGSVRGARAGRAHWVALDSLQDGELLPQALAAALGVRERGGRAGVEALVHALGTRSVLIVLDNCEHLADTCARLAATLLARCPRLRILATSRETLRVPGEVVFRVGELSLSPSGEDHHTAELLGSEAVRLFLARARASDAAFELGPGEARTVAEICRRLDGLPLAIELAAGRAGSLSLPGILHGLDDQLSLLTDGRRTGPGRHRELGAAIDWSHRLLDPLERVVFRRLSVLGGGFDAQGAAAVCADGERPRDGEGHLGGGEYLDVEGSLDGGHLEGVRQRYGAPRQDGIGRPGDAGHPTGTAGQRATAHSPVRPEQVLRVVCALEAKSLVVRVRGDERRDGARFRQLSAIRAYGRERLAEAGELDDTWHRALGWLAGRAAGAVAAETFPDTVEAPLRQEQENLAAAVARCAARSDDRHFPLAVALARLQYQQEQLTAARTLLSGVWEQVPDHEDRVAALALAARSACLQDDHDAALAFAQEAVAVGRAGRQPARLANALDALAAARLYRGEFSEAVAVFAECLDVVRTLGRPLDLALCRHHLAWALLQTGGIAQADALMHECLPELEASAPPGQVTAALHTAGAIRLAQGEVDAAERRFAEVLLKTPPGESFHALYPLEGLAIVAAERGEVERSLRLYAAASAMRRRIDTEPEAHWWGQVEAAVARVKERAHPSGVSAAMAAGRRLRGARLVTYALRGTPLGSTGRDGGQEARPGQGDVIGQPPLTGRESAVAELVAEGMTNQQIAAHLGLSKSTVASHLDRVRDKWGVRSRTQIAVRFAGRAAGPDSGS
ncbi:ATP-binding protein [Streptomyces caniferus]|uniref:ATP-binding protein n=1 Tax=Streptomyces caniferus TaxID=285557 RepID=UPI002E28326F|nr:LuxR C-terminal-related transcriptional regulator [Streptomyces caniferus]